VLNSSDRKVVLFSRSMIHITKLILVLEVFFVKSQCSHTYNIFRINKDFFFLVILLSTLHNIMKLLCLNCN